MLATARRTLVDLGILSLADPTPPFSARMSGNLGLLFYLADGTVYLVKIGLLTRLDREFRGLRAGFDAMPRNVPEPLLLTMQGVHQVLVTRGVKHRPLLPLNGAERIETFARGLAQYVAAAARSFGVRGREGTSRSRLEEALMQAGARFGGWTRERYAQGAVVLAAKLEPILQHGDLAANNIGWDDGALIFFDWEDFGEIDLPGYDVAVLLLSLNAFSFQRLLAKLRYPSMEADIVRFACAASGFSPSEFLQLFPAYASLYIQSKSRLGYPHGVTDRFATVMEDWIRIDNAGGIEAAIIAQDFAYARLASTNAASDPTVANVDPSISSSAIEKP